MDETPDQSPPPTSWTKLALIPVLGGVLWYVLSAPSEEVVAPTLLVTTPQASSVPVSLTPATPAVVPASVVAVPVIASSGAKDRSSAGAVPQNLPLEKEVAKPQTVIWPSTPLAEVMAINPFEVPPGLLPLVTTPSVGPVTESEAVSSQTAALTNAEQERSLAMQAALKQHRLTALVQTSRGVGAIVGETVVAVGDTLGERFRITAIRPDGLVLEWIEEPPETALKD